MPAFAIPRWQSFSPVSPKLRWSGSGVVQSRSEQLGELSPRLPPQTSSPWEAYRVAMNSDSSASFQHLRHSARSVGVAIGL